MYRKSMKKRTGHLKKRNLGEGRKKQGGALLEECTD